jgi:hypothetical protein
MDRAALLCVALNRCGGDVERGQSAPNLAFYRTVHRMIHRTVHRAHIDANPRSNHDSRRSRPQHDAGLYDAADRIFNVFTVHNGTGLFSACGYEPSDQ